MYILNLLNIAVTHHIRKAEYVPDMDWTSLYFSLFDFCHCYILMRINYFKSFNLKYAYN